MEKKINQRVYQPPLAVDLSNMSAVEGVKPLGACASGDYPDFACVAGDRFASSCVPGGTVDTSSCNTGGYHNHPRCVYGSHAAMICNSGVHA